MPGLYSFLWINFSCLGVGADVLDIAGTVIASKELKYDPVSNSKPSTAFQIS